jgi:NAD(P)H-nitrite reductase large subunit
MMELVETDAVILAIGVKPETKLAVEAGLKLAKLVEFW